MSKGLLLVLPCLVQGERPVLLCVCVFAYEMWVCAFVCLVRLCVERGFVYTAQITSRAVVVLESAVDILKVSDGGEGRLPTASQV